MIREEQFGTELGQERLENNKLRSKYPSTGGCPPPGGPYSFARSLNDRPQIHRDGWGFLHAPAVGQKLTKGAQARKARQVRTAGQACQGMALQIRRYISC
jgi:hypothetical protein